MPAKMTTRVGHAGHRITIRPCTSDAGEWVWDASVDGNTRQILQPDGRLQDIRYDQHLGDGVAATMQHAMESAVTTALLHTTGHLPCRWCDSGRVTFECPLDGHCADHQGTTAHDPHWASRQCRTCAGTGWTA